MQVNQAPGRKDDQGKPRFSLLRFGMARALAGVAAVLSFGAKKYADHSWQQVPNGVDRYWSAMERHMNEIALHGAGAVDEESGLLHIDHVACNALFLGELLRGVPVNPAYEVRA
ncbi:dATP/dGTP diphosphohydrolase domain-containing protein [Ralstonia pseudosolanacearum]